MRTRGTHIFCDYPFVLQAFARYFCCSRLHWECDNFIFVQPTLLVCRNKKINWIVTQEHQKLYILCITTKKHANHGRHPPQPLMCVLTTLYAVPHTRNLQNLCCGGCFGHGNTTHQKKLEGKRSRHPPRPLPASVAVWWACLPHRERCWTCMVFLNLRRGVSSIVFFIDEF